MDVNKLASEHKHITIEDVKKMGTFKNWDDEQITELLRTVREFCAVAYSIWSKQEAKEEVEARCQRSGLGEGGV